MGGKKESHRCKCIRKIDEVRENGEDGSLFEVKKFFLKTEMKVDDGKRSITQKLC